MFRPLICRACLGAVAVALVALLPVPLAAQEGTLAPTKVTIVGEGTSVTVRWEPVRGEGVTYRVLRALNTKEPGVDITKEPVDVASVVDPEVVPGTTYFYQVIAMYPDETSAAAAPVEFTAQPVPASSPVLSPSPLPGSALPSQPVVAKTATGTTPTGLRILPSVPIIASLAWDSMPNAVTYSLRRTVGTAASIERVTLGAAAEKGARDTIPDPRDAYLYTLVVTYSDGTWGTSPAVAFTSPPLKNPTGFTATHTGDGNVDFQWQAVPGAASYRLDGPGFPSTGVNIIAATSGSYPKIPGGANTWNLTTLYQGNFADYANPSTASVMMRYLPAHSTPWLSKNNGGGSMETVQLPSLRFAVCDLQAWVACTMETEPPSLMDAYNPESTYPFGSEAFKFGRKGTFKRLKVWLGENYGDVYPGMNYNLWDDPGQDTFEAVYGNAVDLGVGRRSTCFQSMRVRGGWDPITNGLIIPSAWPGMHTVCYASAHGIAPGNPGFNDPAAITQPGTEANRLLTMVIKKDPTGTVFMVFKPTKAYTLSPTVTLDTEGEKYVPHACLSCHGGTYNETTRKVDGASFLPLDPGLLEFASPAEQAGQEEKLRKINAMIVASDPRSAVASYINGLYGNAVVRPGTVAKVDYVPQGWSEQPGFYRSVVKPYCATCHLAAPAIRNFASWDNFKQNASLIKAAVCYTRTMPHSELQYKAFWTKDTGPVYLPGLLASTLNWPGNTPGAPPSCP